MTNRAAQECLPQERHERILDVLKRDGRVVAQALAARFGVSEDSIRRDLRDMAARGLCRRVYGGALAPLSEVAPLAARIATADTARTTLANHAATLVQTGQIVLLDAGATNVEIARALRGKSITLVTNAPAVAAEVSGDADTELIIIGGKVDARSGGAIGSQALQQLEAIQPYVCIPGACAVEPELGIWGMESEESAFKRAMIKASTTVVIVATDAKVGRRGNFRVAGLDQVDHLVISDTVPDEMVARLASHPISLHRVTTE
ncbi:MAG: DeoR/GlpR family DNA-binding transcription regulator [Propionivibrio sp.]